MPTFSWISDRLVLPVFNPFFDERTGCQAGRIHIIIYWQTIINKKKKGKARASPFGNQKPNLQCLFPSIERFDVEIMEFWCEEPLNRIQPLFIFDSGEEVGEGTHQNDVCRLSIA